MGQPLFFGGAPGAGGMIPPFADYLNVFGDFPAPGLPSFAPEGGQAFGGFVGEPFRMSASQPMGTGGTQAPAPLAGNVPGPSGRPDVMAGVAGAASALPGGGVAQPVEMDQRAAEFLGGLNPGGYRYNRRLAALGL